MPLIHSDEGPVAQIFNSNGAAPMVLVCEHSSSFIPNALDDLGLTQEARYAHIAWDIGAYDLAIALSRILDAPLVSSGVSRLVYDCNRPLEDESATPASSEVYEVPGNQSLTVEQRQQRYEEVYLPFGQKVAEQVALKANRLAANEAGDSPVDAGTQTGWVVPLVVTVHSFTPIYHGQRRDVEIGLLHGVDGRFATKMVEIAAGQYGNEWCPIDVQNPLKVELNQPYDASDGVLHTIDVHAGRAGLPHVMIEVNNNLIRDADGVESVSNQLASMIRHALQHGPGQGA